MDKRQRVTQYRGCTVYGPYRDHYPLGDIIAFRVSHPTVGTWEAWHGPDASPLRIMQSIRAVVRAISEQGELRKP
jgi:hypothetical protein